MLHILLIVLYDNNLEKALFIKFFRYRNFPLHFIFN